MNLRPSTAKIPVPWAIFTETDNSRTVVPDILVRNIENSMADRIKEIARERAWSINDVVLHVLKQGLGMSNEPLVTRQHHDIAVLAGTWGPDEAAAFREAVLAFERVSAEIVPTIKPDPEPEKR